VTSACRSLRLQLAAYADDELGVDAAIEVERHLDECGACRRAVGRQRHLSRALRELHPAAAVPDGFESRVRFSLLGPTPARRAAVAGALVVATAAIGGVVAWRDSAPQRVPAHDARPGADPMRSDALVADPAPAVAAAAALHRDADGGALPLELVSHDVAAVNAWLQARLPFAGTIGDPGSDAITLTGAARVMLGEHPAGLVRYRQGGRTISLFLIAEPVWSDGAPPIRVGSVDFRIFQRRGLDLIGWSHAAISYLLVSEDGLTTGEACAACHGSNARGAIAEFVAAVAGQETATGVL
jgi:anti-sigma factor RsiW